MLAPPSSCASPAQDFPAETWGAEELGQADEGLWAEDWEDEDVDVDFDKVLRDELAKHGGGVDGAAAK